MIYVYEFQLFWVKKVLATAWFWAGSIRYHLASLRSGALRAQGDDRGLLPMEMRYSFGQNKGGMGRGSDQLCQDETRHKAKHQADEKGSIARLNRRG